MGCDEDEVGAFKNGTKMGAKIVPQVEWSNNGSQSLSGYQLQKWHQHQK